MDLSAFNRIIDRLRNPDAYDHPVSSVDVIETHISSVLLAGNYAYKVKKPVDFGFVDFSTLAKRKQFCEEELRLNRRFAPELYLDVAAIRGTVESPTFKRDGPPFEYAVKMRRFDQDALLDRGISREGLVTPSMIEDFAADVAAVHASAAAAASDAEYGTPKVIAANVRECWAPIRDAGLFDWDRSNRRVVEHMDERAAALAPRFEQRLRDGRVRECHGDLHLGNLYLADGRIRAFDCIEFNPALRWIDVANDIAFTTMDLRFHCKAGYARRFRNAYLDASGDYSALGVLGFYETYRALVRAKVAGLREAEETGAGLGDATRHMDLASRLIEPARSTPLIVTCGLSGSGKTYVSGELLAGSEAIRIRSDVERDRYVKKETGRYTSANIQAVYTRLLSTAAEIIEAGYPVVVDATFLNHARRERFRWLAERLSVPFRILHCTARESELRRRIAERTRVGHDASEADLSVLSYQLQHMEALTEKEKQYIVPYDTESPPAFNELLSSLLLSPDPHIRS